MLLVTALFRSLWSLKREMGPLDLAISGKEATFALEDIIRFNTSGIKGVSGFEEVVTSRQLQKLCDIMLQREKRGGFDKITD